MVQSSYIACSECDLLHRVDTLPARTTARCRRCAAELCRNTEGGLDRALALSLAAAVLFIVANVFPIAEVGVNGQYTHATILGSVHLLYEQGEALVASLVLATVIAAPALELATLCYMLLPLHFGRRPRHLPFAFRVLQRVREWSLLDVFMLGLLVTLIKLKPIMSVVPGAAVWSLGGAILLAAAVLASIDTRELWLRAEALDERR